LRWLEVCRLFTSSEQRLAEGLVTLKELLEDLSVLKLRPEVYLQQTHVLPLESGTTRRFTN
jgi:hypothetical protein